MKTRCITVLTGVCFAAILFGGWNSAAGQKFVQTNLVSDLPGVAAFQDANLVNAWGLVVTGSPGLAWVADNGTGLITVYRSANGKPFPSPAHPMIITVPPPGGSPAGTTATPTGLILNDTRDFVVKAGKRSAPATLIVVTEDGTLSAWNEHVSRGNAILEVDNSASSAVYKGVAAGKNSTGNFLFATNFRAATIDVFDKNFKPATLTGNFTDPSLPAGYAPFGIRNIGGNLYVTYAMQDALKHDDVPGPGFGFVDVFDTDGNFLSQFATQGTLNSPWGLALAPKNFGAFSNALLVGNFGDGAINAFDAGTGVLLGQFQDAAGNPLSINGLWSLTFGPAKGGEDQDEQGQDQDQDQDHGKAKGNAKGKAKTATLFFAAGLNDEKDGLFGTLTPVVAPSGKKGK